jgi:hypothetical protein
LLEATGVAGIGLTITTTVPVGPGQFPNEAFTLYVPAAAAVAEGIDVFCEFELNPLGPLHVYVAPEIVVAERFNVVPAHNGEFEEAPGATGVGLTTTVVDPAGPVHPAAEVTTEYVPDAEAEAIDIVGF